jgi:hypothetical protein
MFADAGLTEPRALPSSGYWGFVRSANSLKGRLLGMPVRALFWITSELKPLRGSVLAPWIVVCGRKASS